MAAPNGYSVVNFSVNLLLTFGVNYQHLVVGENVAARGYTILLINLMYINSTSIINKKHAVRNKNKCIVVRIGTNK